MAKLVPYHEMEYRPLWPSDGGPPVPEVQCVIDQVSYEGPGADAGVPLVRFEYARGPDGIERPGLLARAVHSNGEIEQYEYDGGLRVSEVSDAGVDYLVSEHSRSGSTVLDNGGGMSISASWTSTSWPVVQNLTEVEDNAVSNGTGGTLSSGLTTTYSWQYSTTVDGMSGAQLSSVEHACGTSNACSAGTIQYGFTTMGMPGPQVLSSRRDKLSSYDVSTIAAGPTAAPQLTEETNRKEGATSTSGMSALRETNFTYSYGSDNTQRVATETKTSVLQTSSTIGTTYTYDSANRVTREIQSGYTRDLSGTDSLKRVATFYFRTASARGNCEGNSDTAVTFLEVHGPCFVSSDTATDCDDTTYPLTQYTYWPPSDTTANRGQLKQVSRFPSGCSSTPVATKYDTYDGAGNVLTERDASNVTTTYTWDAPRHKMLSRTVGSATTHYGYEKNELAWIQFPQGNYEVYCHWSGTGGGCGGGTWSPQVLWKAKATNQSGADWSEKVEYLYWPDMSLRQEKFSSREDEGGSTTVRTRRIHQYAVDAHKRPTMEGWGGNAATPTAPAYAIKRGFDGGDNLVGLGLPFNSPPDFCGGSSGSAACSSMTYDRVHELTRLIEQPNGSSGDPVTTCFTWDAHGNVASVSAGCKGTTDCPSGIGNCSNMVATYEHDDFGNLVDALLPDTGTSSTHGSTRFEYDAAGNLVKKSTPASRGQTGGPYWHEYVHDQMGRMLEAKYRNSSTPTTLYALDWDTQGDAVPSSCGTIANTMGRLRERVDSFGSTFYSYDGEGRTVSELRLRTGTTSCTTPGAGEAANDNPHTLYSWSANGNLTSITYPHGRVVDYGYQTSNPDRVSSISVTWVNAPSGTPTQVISDVRWEPYGGLRAWQVNAPLASSGNRAFAVEFMAGAAGGAPGFFDDCSLSTRSETSDATGRLRAIWVSHAPLYGGSTPSGDVFKRFYTWSADQITRQDTCLLTTSAGFRTETFSYDQMLRLVGASVPNFSTTGGAYSSRTWNLDGRGNRVAEAGTGESGASGSNTYTYGYTYGSNGLGDQLTRKRTTYADDVYTEYTYDADGRAVTKVTGYDSTNTGAPLLQFDYGAMDHGGAETVYRSVDVNTAGTYVYFYDAFNRRRFKSYPDGATDEFFHDTANQLLEDRGSEDLTGGSTYPIDEYIWLGGRPVAFVRSKFGNTWARANDLTGTCTRNGEDSACGIYFVVTDHIGKPVLLLDSSGKVAGQADYEPFGEPNRVTHRAHTSYPYYSNSITNDTVTSFTQPRPSGEEMKVRVVFAMVDTESVTKDWAWLTNSSGTDLGASHIGGQHKGRMFSDWVQMPSNNTVAVHFRSDGENCCPAGSGTLSCAAPCSVSCPSYELTGCDWPNFGYRGISVEGYEYQRYESGASATWIPLRFQGQYYDVETDLVENWNRYYESSTGRYLSLEPDLLRPRGSKVAAAYDYVQHMPIAAADPTGMYMLLDHCTNWNVALERAQRVAGCGVSPEEPDPCDDCNKCRAKFKACKQCDPCLILNDPSWPKAVVTRQLGAEKIPETFDPAWGLTSQGNNYYADLVEFDSALCTDPSKVELLARTMIHEAAHVCAQFSGKDPGDDPTETSLCDAWGIERDCFR